MTATKVWTRLRRGSFPWYSPREGTPNLATTEQNEQHPQNLPRGGDERIEQADLMVTTRNRPRRLRRMVQQALDGGKAEARCTCGKVSKTPED